MNSYILLRDNKESGSLGLEDLKKLGLKPSDLIWVECQSVGWRNPHEIAELKPLLSSTRDLPVIADLETPVDIIPETVPQPVPEVIETPTAPEPKKKMVYVELPSKPVATKKAEPETVKKDAIPDFHQYVGLAASTVPVVENTPVDTPGEIATKYSRPLDEIKEMYVRNMHQKEQHKKGIIAIQLPKEVKKGMVYVGFALAGAMIMLFIRDAGGKQPVTVEPVQQSTLAATVTDTSIPESITMNIQPSLEEDYQPAGETRNVSVYEEQPLVKVSTPGKKTPLERKDQDGAEQTAAEKNNTAIKEERLPVKPVPAGNLSSQLSVKANEYETGSFGGIRNLEMTLQNDSKYMLDKVIVELKYLNPEGMTLKTEDIYFHSVYPGEAETIAVKKSKRGVKIAYKITGIESKEVGGSTSGL